LSRSFDQLKRALADLPVEYLEAIVQTGRDAVSECRQEYRDGLIELRDVEATEHAAELCQIGLWIVKREQRARRN
jgi:hypothetical protein